MQLLQLTRPLMALKSILIVMFGAFLAAGSSAIADRATWLAISSVSIAWAGLYTLNDFMDWDEDRADAEKARSKKIDVLPKTAVLAFAVVLICAGWLLSFTVGGALVILIALMILSQCLYSGPIARLKYAPIIGTALVAVINPFLRFSAGWMLFEGFSIPFFALLMLTAFSLSVALTRESLLLIHGQPKRAATIVLLGIKFADRINLGLAALSITAFALLCFGPFKFATAQTLPVEFS